MSEILNNIFLACLCIMILSAFVLFSVILGYIPFNSNTKPFLVVVFGVIVICIIVCSITIKYTDRKLFTRNK